MSYTKFKVKDNSQWNLLTSISSSTASIVLESWDWWNFPTVSWSERVVVTLEQLSWWVVTKREKCLVTSRSWDTLSVTRWYWWTTAQAFASGDFVSVYLTEDVIQDIQDEIENLGTIKLNKNWATRTWLSANKIIYVNSSGAETVLSLWANNTYLKSNWSTSAPSFATPPLDVNGQSTVTTIQRTLDYIAIHDASAGGTRKVLIDKIAPTATTTVEWLVERATDAEATAGTDTTRYVTPKQVKDKVTSATPDSSTTVKWLVERATDAEVLAKSDTTRYVTPDQVDTYYTMKSRVLWQVFVMWDSTTTLNIPHWCTRPPTCIIFSGWWSWTKDWATTIQKVYDPWNSSWSGAWFIDFVLVKRETADTNERSRRKVTSVDSTNINMTRSYAGGFSDSDLPQMITVMYQ